MYLVYTMLLILYNLALWNRHQDTTVSYIPNVHLITNQEHNTNRVHSYFDCWNAWWTTFRICHPWVCHTRLQPIVFARKHTIHNHITVSCLPGSTTSAESLSLVVLETLNIRFHQYTIVVIYSLASNIYTKNFFEKSLLIKYWMVI